MITLIVCLIWIALVMVLRMVLVRVVVPSTARMVVVIPSIWKVLSSHRLCWTGCACVSGKSLLHCGWHWLFRKSLLRKIVQYALVFLQALQQFLKTGNYIVRVLAVSNPASIFTLLILGILFWNLKNIEFVSFPSKCLGRIKSAKIHALVF